MKKTMYLKFKTTTYPVLIFLFVLGMGAVVARADNGDFKRGAEYARRGEHEKAAERFQAAINKDTSHPDARLAMGVTLINMKKPGRALPYIRRARQLDPKNKKILFVLAKLEEKLNNISRAIETWENFLRLEPEGKYRRIAERHLNRLKETR